MDEKIRINKYLSDAGVCSRREADRLTEAGRVTVRGTVVSTGEKIFPDEEICIDGKPIKKQEKKILIFSSIVLLYNFLYILSTVKFFWNFFQKGRNGESPCILSDFIV